MTKLVLFDEKLRVRAELDQRGIRESGLELIAAIDAAASANPGLAELLTPLRAYALAGVNGQIVHPRVWEGEPLRYEFKEDLLPESILNAYGKYAFYTHGLTRNSPSPVYRDGKAYIEVED